MPGVDASPAYAEKQGRRVPAGGRALARMLGAPDGGAADYELVCSLINRDQERSREIQIKTEDSNSICYSQKTLLKTPLLPPSSATVTIAVTLLLNLLSPFKRVDNPVPPPIATILGPLFSLLLTLNASTKNVLFSGTSAF